MDKILDLKFNSFDLDKEVTIREFFHKLLLKLWVDGETFDGKYPFGHSGWDGDLIVCLIKNGLIDGTLDQNDSVDEIDEEEVRRYVIENIINPIFNSK